MARKNKTEPTTWLPPPDKPDEECNLLELWSRYCQEIAVFRGFRDPADRLSDYSQTLATISQALSAAPACNLSAFDILEAITSVRTYISGGATKLYADGIYDKRLAIIRDTYKYLEARGICINPLWHPPWELIGDGRLDPWLTIAEIRDKLQEESEILTAKRILPRYLLDTMERRLMHRIIDNIGSDGRWAGILILLWHGPRLSEARGLHYRDLVPLTARPDRRKINLHYTADEDGQEQDTMKNRQSVRAVAEHIESMILLLQRENQIKSDLSVNDIGDLPIICYGNDYTRPCTAAEFARFCRRELDNLLDPVSKRAALISLYLSDDLSDTSTDPIDLELSGRLLRRNYATQCYAKTALSDDDIAITMGHKIAKGLGSIYSEHNILRLMDMLDHRMIIPDIHPGWDHTLHLGDNVDTVDTGTVFLRLDDVLLQRGGTIDIIAQTMLPGDAITLEINRKLPQGVVANFEVLHLPAPERHDRPNTDTLHQPLPKWPAE